MQSIPIKKAWKKPKRIFFRQLKKGDSYYYERSKIDALGKAITSFERIESYGGGWHAMAYLGTDENDQPVFFAVGSWKPCWSKADAEAELKRVLFEDGQFVPENILTITPKAA
ncbi:hypothetical protein [Maridesulfovibrio sp.]|uniref:hypothetical protein n=1 Tax=Maridesulfovibrio sp. TaxID=2795000 RepID=UPI002AA6A5F2|nr:hypothetical protein [Maridesulfovibrio sp.]